ncbi:MAG: VWA domain-containing protein [Nannocystis sp.]|nr:VWA domain-containing protein [Nannocystis sp.]
MARSRRQGRLLGAGLFACAGLVACGDDGGGGSMTGSTQGFTSSTQGSTDSGGTETTASGSESAGTTTDSATTTDAATWSTTSAGESDSSSATDSDAGTDSDTATDSDTEGEVCEPPDVLIVLDRTLTMHRTPSGAVPVDGPEYKSSKWSQAIVAIEGLVAPPFDSSVRFGLELWPRDPGDGACVTLAERVTNSKQATNPACEQGEVVVEVGLDQGQTIIDLLDPTTTTICSSTPTGEALYGAGSYLEGIKVAGRDQYVVLITDGADWDQTCPLPDPLKAVQELEAKGIKTFVVGFSAEQAPPGALSYLNNLACAGQTAKGFPGPCYDTPDGWTGVVVEDPFPVYLQAEDAKDLGLALQSVLDDVCCGCSKGCDAPEVLFAVDRTLTMHRTPDGDVPVDAPDYQSSRWYQALTSIKDVVTTPALDSKLRLGLELWPRDPGGGQCITLAERVTNSKQASNPACEFGEIVAPPALKTGAAIDGLLDPATTTICSTTPTGNGLITAFAWLVDHLVPGRDQYVVLVTDGSDWDGTCPSPSPLTVVQQLAAAGIKTYVVGFFGVVENQKAASFLNDLACAGQTAKGFPGPCTSTMQGWQAKDPASLDPLYLRAGDGELEVTLGGVADEIVAMCVPG